ncbi:MULTISPECIES: hypothetical protein [Cupriavidus]|uniref:hypothetical protein n=1 Tax=Cupriavidus sp. TaxID=1873897 RepID=UPI003D12AE38
MFRNMLQAQFNRESLAGGIGINPRMDRGAERVGRTYRQPRKLALRGLGADEPNGQMEMKKAGSIAASGFLEFAGGA